MTVALRLLSLCAVAAVSLACSSSETSSPSGSPAAPGAAGASQAASTKELEARLQKAGWTIKSSEDDGDDWPSRYIKMEKGEDDDFQRATVWIDAFGDAHEGKPKPHVVVGKGALIRFGWDPSDPSKPAVDVAGFAKDIVALTPPELATDNLFSTLKFDEVVKKWGMGGADSGSGGRVSQAGVVFNHRTPMSEAGTVRMEIVHYQRPLESGDVRLFGTTLVSVGTDDAKTKKAILDALSR